MKSYWSVYCLFVVSYLFQSTCFAALGEGENEKERITGIEASMREVSGTEFGLALDLRPSWESGRGAIHLENEVALEMAFSPRLHLGYTQEFQTNLFEPTSAQSEGINPQAHDGYLRGDFSEIWESAQINFSWESRAYFPTHAPERDAGLITALRNYAKLSFRATETLELSLWEVPIVHIYSRSGSTGAEGPEANPIFESRVYLSTNFSFFNKKLSFKIPLILQTIRHASFAEGAKHNNSWSHILWVYPELTYALSEKMSIGLGYYSENLIVDNFSKTSFSRGLQKGVTQFIFQQSI